MIRPALPDDSKTLISLADETGVFKGIEIQALGEVLDDYHAANQRLGHRAVVVCEGSAICGFAYYAPAAMTCATWYLYWIAVAKSRHRSGIGAELMRHVEADIRGAEGRLLLIETSSLDHYLPTRQFYLRQGYHQTAVLRDYYADGDDMVVFAKRFAPEKNPAP
jgi:ribosomal protein S18 acetylase RimI-like enzyme